MGSKLLMLLSVAAAVVLAASAGAQASFFDDIENYTVDTNIIGQAGPPGGWEGWDLDPTITAPVRDEYAYSGSKSVEISSSNITDLVHQFSGMTSGLWQISAMLYIPSNSTGNTYFIVMDQYTAGGDPKSWSCQMLANMTDGVMVSDTPGGGSPLQLVRDQWAEIRVDVNLDTLTADFYYNGALLTSGTWASSNIAAMDLWPDTTSPVYYDNISLTPEPATLSLLALGGLALLRRRK